MKKSLSAILLILTGLFTIAWVSGYEDVIPKANNTYKAGSTTMRFSEVNAYDADYADDLTVGDDATISGTLTVGSDSITAINKTLHLPIMSSVVVDTTLSLPTASTTPGIETDNLLQAIVWSDGETTPIAITFTVPQDYISAGKFKVVADQSTSTTPHQIDFLVYVNTADAAAGWDSAATDQTAVALGNDAGTPCLVTLTPATDFATLAAGDIVTVKLWRDDVTTGTGDLEIYDAYFDYD